VSGEGDVLKTPSSFSHRFSPSPFRVKNLPDENVENQPKDVAEPQPQTQAPEPQTQPTPLQAEVKKNSEAPVFLLKLKASILAAVFTAISVIIDEATFTISSGSVDLRAMDPSRVAMIVFGYPKEAFDEFSVDREGKICFNISEALKIIRRAGKDDTVELVMSKEATLGRLLLTVKIHGKYERVFTLPILEAAEEELPTPKINFDTTVKMTVQGLNSAVQDAQLVSDHVKITASPDMIRFQAAGDLSDADIKFVKGVSGDLFDIATTQDLFDIATTQGAKAVFSLQYLTEMAKKLVDVADTVTLDMATDMPIKLEAQNVKGSMVFFQAPRIEVE